jgi:hypothetical protein
MAAAANQGAGMAAAVARSDGDSPTFLPAVCLCASCVFRHQPASLAPAGVMTNCTGQQPQQPNIEARGGGGVDGGGGAGAGGVEAGTQGVRYGQTVSGGGGGGGRVGGGVRVVRGVVVKHEHPTASVSTAAAAAAAAAAARTAPVMQHLDAHVSYALSDVRDDLYVHNDWVRVVGRYKLNAVEARSRLKAPGFNLRTYQVKFQILRFQIRLVPLQRGRRGAEGDRCRGGDDVERRVSRIPLLDVA